jgi:nicotinamide-nucleotide amidase
MKTRLQQVHEEYNALTNALIEKNITITTMESCTAGLIASLITDTEGSSAILRGAYITYSNQAKIQAGVPSEIIEKHGVYSAETAAAMATACRKAFDADIGIGVTGSMGNIDPANGDSVPGEIYVAIDFKGDIKQHHIKILPQESRFDYKLAVADEVVKELLILISLKN